MLMGTVYSILKPGHIIHIDFVLFVVTNTHAVFWEQINDIPDQDKGGY